LSQVFVDTVALAAWQSSSDVNSFSSRRDKALASDDDRKFPLAGLTEQENLGHDLFYGKARCSACHNGVPQGQPADANGEAPQQLYTDNRYHHIGVPFNREIPGVAKGEKTGLRAHVTTVPAGEFKTPTVRNVAKGVSASFTKAYTHNGWFKSLESLVHFYNTRDALPRCETLGIVNATEKEALQNNCWPASEFPNPAVGVIGNLRLTASEEAAVVAYMKTLTDEHTPARP
jgi:cytochrome c peroxidase